MIRNAKIALLRILILAAALVVAWLVCGCVSIAGRALGAWGEPYYTTRMVYDFASKRGEPGYYAWLPCEAVADTVFLPADALVKWVRD